VITSSEVPCVHHTAAALAPQGRLGRVRAKREFFWDGFKNSHWMGFFCEWIFLGWIFLRSANLEWGKKRGIQKFPLWKKQKKNFRRDTWRSCHYGYNLEGTTGGALVTTDINFEGTLGSALVTTVLLW
jgi:hypothetical protein